MARPAALVLRALGDAVAVGAALVLHRARSSRARSCSRTPSPTAATWARTTTPRLHARHAAAEGRGHRLVSRQLLRVPALPVLLLRCRSSSSRCSRSSSPDGRVQARHGARHVPAADLRVPRAAAGGHARSPGRRSARSTPLCFLFMEANSMWGGQHPVDAGGRVRVLARASRSRCSSWARCARRSTPARRGVGGAPRGRRRHVARLHAALGRPRLARRAGRGARLVAPRRRADGDPRPRHPAHGVLALPAARLRAVDDVVQPRLDHQELEGGPAADPLAAAGIARSRRCSSTRRLAVVACEPFPRDLAQSGGRP